MNFIEKWIRRIVREEIEKREKERKVNVVDALRLGVEEGRKRPYSLPREDT